MSKIFPIKVEKVNTNSAVVVEWMISNVCNYNCSYCSPHNKIGDKRYLDIDVYKNIILKLTEEAKDKKIWFKITGGEPTLYPKLIELLTFIKDTGNFTYLMTNGSRTLRWWEELKDSGCIDFIALSFHPEQANDYNHFMKVIKLFDNSVTTVIVNILATVSKFEYAHEFYKQLVNDSSALANLQPIIDEYGIEKYSKEQQEILLNASMGVGSKFNLKPKSNISNNLQYHSGYLKYTYSDGTFKKDFGINFLKRAENNFYGWECDVGKEFIRVEHTIIQRGLCAVGDKWSVYSKNLFAKTPVICEKDKCDCILDLSQPKRKII